MQKRPLADATRLDITMQRLCFQLIENHGDFSKTALIGLQPRGVFVARRLKAHLERILTGQQVRLGELDVTFYRDDFRRREILAPSSTKMDFVIEGLKVVLVDDVLYTGRTIRSGLDAIIDFGRPEKVELLALVDRRYSRHLPIEPDYIGISVDTITEEKVKVQWKETDGEDGIWLV
ncbi:MAG: bifunctional pyr operon transcriptional regulator/uracil phosphoribosyltransferase PyrR [Bacteroidia bacterium]|nr:bifunctional pyr operon transcriptional regulator/uracil phosphoribosyltransferase PyrR [Bacteroidia bacterium]MBP7270488.1 bifunctional pyr operon transcriptional regulator/uracil phosphoribosyltransferase PyrR [Bacteroidia bacterium]MBP7436901.1 bifunctional pyr operon transcriptional regulator/uracil phosphoribosyltransferase PyrR [Bacteroidia bacterium]MBP7773342.1 bifunctional pyr operon transcriptional regulator/uracil phosphoribosyltransferase PyrR [Bacteroidia bacterium]